MEESQLALELGFRDGNNPMIEAIDLSPDAVAEWRKQEGKRLTRQYNALGGRTGDRARRMIMNPSLPSPQTFDAELGAIWRSQRTNSPRAR